MLYSFQVWRTAPNASPMRSTRAFATLAQARAHALQLSAMHHGEVDMFECDPFKSWADSFLETAQAAPVWPQAI